ncbi:recombination regulator RecX [Spirabiliibacterium falconis]|uniref:recombination regulator RecX n=1 Tax=Spirabiliibacterium falconis TaxID=572023 RepID=UPI001AADCC7D|nr:recombination regulator RecX [Spirabiliibacterium falconis]MBE2895113.1 recombination regulator RecX [Spirabiliibacterium falconis]
MDKTALHYAVGLLAHRDYSALEIQQKMQQKAIDEHTIAEVMSYCQQRGWQSNERFCDSFIRSRVQRGYGPLRIQQELKQKGIESALITERFASLNLDWFALAETVFKKKFTHFDGKLNTQQKAWRFMTNRGFLADHFSYLIRQSYDE